MSQLLHPVFENGHWLYPDITMGEIPKGNRRIVLLSWPSEYIYDEDKGWDSVVKSVIIETPENPDRKWFEGQIRFNLGANCSGWYYAP